MEDPQGRRAFRNKTLDDFLFCCSRLVGTVQKFSEAVAFICRFPGSVYTQNLSLLCLIRARFFHRSRSAAHRWWWRCPCSPAGSTVCVAGLRAQPRAGTSHMLLLLLLLLSTHVNPKFGVLSPCCYEARLQPQFGEVLVLFKEKH